jgi:hypothetical protein
MTIAIRPALRVTVEGSAEAATLTRVRASDLRLARRERSVLLAEAAAAGLPVSPVALEVEVVIDELAADARARVAATPLSSGTVGYVGTPAGLRSLIEDVYAAEVADAVVLRPREPRSAELLRGLLAA